jgi:hypothetical protein
MWDYPIELYFGEGDGIIDRAILQGLDCGCWVCGNHNWHLLRFRAGYEVSRFYYLWLRGGALARPGIHSHSQLSARHGFAHPHCVHNGGHNHHASHYQAGRRPVGCTPLRFLFRHDLWLHSSHGHPGSRCCWNSRRQSSGYSFAEERRRPSPPSPPTTVRQQEAQQSAMRGSL